MNKYTLVVVLLFLTASSNAQKADAFKWMIGTWKIITGDGDIVESWQLKNDSTLQGHSYFVRKSIDTIPQETIELAFRNGDWYYIPTVKGQNNNQSVQFKIVFQRGSEFISENPAHDFPQRIAYRRIKKQLFASIEGRKNGKYNKQNFDFSGE
jgi:Domain of unknown function (DUF6265)